MDLICKAPMPHLPGRALILLGHCGASVAAFLDYILRVCQSLLDSFLWLEKLHRFLYLMLSYFYDPSICLFYCWNSNLVKNVVFEREHAWRPRCHLVPPACVLYCVEREFDQIIMKLCLRLTAE